MGFVWFNRNVNDADIIGEIMASSRIAITSQANLLSIFHPADTICEIEGIKT